MTTAEIITIGTELLLGESLDTNTHYIARALRSLGVDLYRTQTVGDNVQRIAAIMQESINRADFVISTGGLGPTIDDPTREAAALASRQKLEFRPDLWEQIKNRISRYGRIPTENQKRQAYLPRSSIAIQNTTGTAPAFIIEIGRKSLICLPGVPKEMETLMETEVMPYLQSRFDIKDILTIRTLNASGVSESYIDNFIGDYELKTNPTVGLTAHSGIVNIRIAVKGTLKAENERKIKEIETELRSRLGEAIYGVDTETLESVVLESIFRLNWSLATLEPLTSDTLRTRLAYMHHPAYMGGESKAFMPDQITSALLEEMENRQTDVGLAIHYFYEQDNALLTISIVTPQQRDELRKQYSGHPGNFARWSTNMALDSLRRMLNRS